MIVIATHNSPESLERLLNSISLYWNDLEFWDEGAPKGWEGDYCDVLVVGTSKGQEAIARQAMKNWGSATNISIRFTEVPWENSGYDTGAYIWAFQQYKAMSYLFMHDSMVITGKDWLKQFHEIAKQGADVVPWCTFSPYLLGVEQDEERIIRDTYGLYEEPGYGFFGPIFWAKRSALKKIKDAGYMNYIPSQKKQAQACERFWSLYCARLKIPVIPVHPDGFATVYHGSQHPNISKHFLRRP